MGDKTACLNGEDEPFRRGIMPLLEGLLLRQPVERVIDFHGVEVPGIVAKEVSFRNTGRVEGTDPVLVMPAGSPDMNRSICLPLAEILSACDCNTAIFKVSTLSEIDNSSPFVLS